MSILLSVMWGVLGGGPVFAGPSTEKLIALTFDACQTEKPAGYDAKVIQILRETHTPATLFLGGRWAEAHAAQAKKLGADPLFEIAQHSYLHPHMKKLTVTQATEDLNRAQQAIQRATGRLPRLFRPPFGEWDYSLVAASRGLGLTTVQWSIETGDPDKNVSAKSIVAAVLSQARPGGVVIMHMNGRGWHTAEALPSVISGLRRKGFRLASVGELLALGKQRSSW